MTIVNLTKDNFDEMMNKNDIVVIDFWAEWCGPCKSFAPIYEAVAAMHTDVCFTQVNVEEEKELAADFNVYSIPTLAILRKNVVVFTDSGMLPKSALDDLVKQAKNLKD